MEDVDIRRRIFLPLFELEELKSVRIFHSRKSCLHLTYWAGPNRRNWVWKNANSFFSDVFTVVVVVVNHSYDYRPNCIPLSPVTITNQCQWVLRFFLSKLIYKSNRKLFPCICIAWYKHSRSWENSPNPSRVYIRLCKHGKRFLLLKHYILQELMLFTHAIQIHFLQVGHRIHF